nr:hypothetical protein Iba_scaffold66342CG0010 [Ipomoea batatas]GMD08398.1 hypothetical protein Iba_chr06cCG16290 [Ipomoea batatas]
MHFLFFKRSSVPFDVWRLPEKSLWPSGCCLFWCYLLFPRDPEGLSPWDACLPLESRLGEYLCTGERLLSSFSLKSPR